MNNLQNGSISSVLNSMANENHNDGETLVEPPPIIKEEKFEPNFGEVFYTQNSNKMYDSVYLDFINKENFKDFNNINFGLKIENAERKLSCPEEEDFDLNYYCFNKNILENLSLGEADEYQHEGEEEKKDGNNPIGDFKSCKEEVESLSEETPIKIPLSDKSRKNTLSKEGEDIKDILDAKNKNENGENSSLNASIKDSLENHLSAAPYIPKNYKNFQGKNEWENSENLLSLEHPPFIPEGESYLPSDLFELNTEALKEKRRLKYMPEGYILKNPRNDFEEDYIIVRYGKRGWICKKCNNFNFAGRKACNRCQLPMNPKKINERIEQIERKNQADEFLYGNFQNFPIDNEFAKLSLEEGQTMEEAGNDLSLQALMEKKKKEEMLKKIQNQKIPMIGKNSAVRRKKEPLPNKMNLDIQKNEGNWLCPYCGNYNYYFRQNCYKCNILRYLAETFHPNVPKEE
ncbi:MAG: zinc finger Ran-binding domain-containing protein [archaeon]|nr:zinc finger Ran-binding domain-containing protein [archaeon]